VKNTKLEIRPSLSANLLEDSPRLIIAALILIFSVIVMAISDNLFWALVILVLIFSAIVLHYYVLLQSCILTVNDTSVQMRLGWLSHTTSTITLRKMESTALHQSLLGRYWNFGRIELKAPEALVIFLRPLTIPHS
jgi:uncharacterized membrane protein YdbT with pleckstrin-like domain